MRPVIEAYIAGWESVAKSLPDAGFVASECAHAQWTPLEACAAAIEKASKWVHEKNLSKLGYVRIPGATGTKPAKGGGNLVLARKGSELRDKAEKLGLNKKVDAKANAAPREMTPGEKEIADTVAEHKSRDVSGAASSSGDATSTQDGAVAIDDYRKMGGKRAIALKHEDGSVSLHIFDKKDAAKEFFNSKGSARVLSNAVMRKSETGATIRAQVESLKHRPSVFYNGTPAIFSGSKASSPELEHIERVIQQSGFGRVAGHVTDEASAVRSYARLMSVGAGKKEKAKRIVEHAMEAAIPNIYSKASDLVAAEGVFRDGLPNKSLMDWFTTSDLGREAERHSLSYDFAETARGGWFTNGRMAFKLNDIDAKKVLEHSKNGRAPNLSSVISGASQAALDVSVSGHRLSEFHDNGDMVYSLTSGGRVNAKMWNTISRRFPNHSPFCDSSGIVYWKKDRNSRDAVAVLMPLK